MASSSGAQQRTGKYPIGYPRKSRRLRDQENPGAVKRSCALVPAKATRCAQVSSGIDATGKPGAMAPPGPIPGLPRPLRICTKNTQICQSIEAPMMASAKPPY
jgi:hypothetical protein